MLAAGIPALERRKKHATSTGEFFAKSISFAERGCE
jgi:hypothetical protein